MKVVIILKKCPYLNSIICFTKKPQLELLEGSFEFTEGNNTREKVLF